MKKKVLIITESTSGGVRRHVIDLVLGINKEKFDVYLLYSSKRADEIFKNSKELLGKNAILIESEYLVRNLSLKDDLRAYKEIRSIIKRINPDIVHCHSSKAGALGRIAAKVTKVEKIFYTPHAYFFQDPNITSKKRTFYIFIERLLSKFFTSKTFNVSNGERNCALEYKIDSCEKFITIYNGINEEKFSNKNLLKGELNLPDESIIVGVTARLDNQKDPITFMKIAKEVINDNKYVHFIYIGEGPLSAEVVKFIKTNNLEKNIHLLGFRNDADKIVSCFDLYLITSLYEGLPYSAIEAMRAEIPIVATDVIGNNEIVISGTTGELFEKGNFMQGAIIIKDLIKNKEIKSKYKNIGKVFREKFTIDNMINSIEAEYNK